MTTPTCNLQTIIRFEDRHFVWNHHHHHPLCGDDGDDDGNDVLDFVSEHTGWPRSRLERIISDNNNNTNKISNDDHVDYISVRVISSLRGGKGGFGSLLKSQSRQAGAKATTNFGACRDLQGRRLRHVNDNIAAQNFAEWQEKIDAGQATEDDMVKALVEQTSSGIPGWHLQLPAWADVSKKEHRTWRRQYHLWKQSKQANESKHRHERELRESRVQHYVDQASQASAAVQASLQSALQQGLQSQQEKQSSKNKRRKREQEPPTALLTLTGEVVLAANENDVWQVQTKSNFATFGIVLDRAHFSLTTAVTTKNGTTATDSLYYWEVRLVTAGLCQIGWATAQFSPTSDTGDGVGDDAHSFAYDGSRRICLHQSESKEYPKAVAGQPQQPSIWKAGDVVGCLWNRTKGTLSFQLNGRDLGLAYEINNPKEDNGTILFPAASCNADEILELHLRHSEMVHAPKDVIAVGDVLAAEEEKDLSFSAGAEETAETATSEKDDVNDKKVAAVESAKKAAPKPEVIVEPLDLDNFETIDQLEAEGLDRLKGALMAIGVKCGGTLRQRAERLLSLKGLEQKDFPTKLLAKNSSA